MLTTILVTYSSSYLTNKLCHFKSGAIHWLDKRDYNNTSSFWNSAICQHHKSRTHLRITKIMDSQGHPQTPLVCLFWVLFGSREDTRIKGGSASWGQVAIFPKSLSVSPGFSPRRKIVQPKNISHIHTHTRTHT